MSLLEELNTLISGLGIPVETGVFTGTPPPLYAVLTPLADTFPLCADNKPVIDRQDVRISLFTKKNPRIIKDRIVNAVINAGITIVDRVFVEHEHDTGYFHYCVDVANGYNWEEEK
jgi:hypothetical protein